MARSPKKLNVQLGRITEPPDDQKKAISHYAEFVGQSAIHWNTLHLKYQLLFCGFIDPGNRDVGCALWNAAKSDSLQRDMLLAIAKIKVTDKKIFEGLKWSCSQAKELSNYRNPFIHAAPFLDISGKKPKIMFVDSISLKQVTYIKNDWLPLGKKFLADLRKLERYVGALQMCLIYDLPLKQPRRPSLRSIGNLRAINAQNSLAHRKPTRARRPSKRRGKP